jgi:glycosyltransferase involved in cell wall biosynthesis
MRELAARLGANVTFLGHMSGTALRDAVRNARAVVLPSEWYENAPVSVLEAYACGKPVIGARIGGIPELVRENETGICFESASVPGLAAALRDMQSRPDSELEQMGRLGRRWVEQEFTVAMYQQRILAAYRELGVALPARDALPLSAPL